MDKKQIYIYTKRRARVDSKSQYVELIPKLFGDLYNDSNDFTNYFIGKIKDIMKSENIKNLDNLDNLDNLENILEYFMKDESNYINKIKNITPDEIEIIKELNRQIIKESFIENTEENKNAFIEHLFRGHVDMQYGIYFSLIYAKDDIEFIDFMGRTSKSTPEDRIIYYTTIDNLVDHVLKIKNDYDFNLPLLYLNSSWNYGKIEDDTILLNNEKNEFIENIRKKYEGGFSDREELICQIPLSTTLFKFIFVSIYMQKYLKYKQKYLKLKKILNKY